MALSSVYRFLPIATLGWKSHENSGRVLFSRNWLDMRAESPHHMPTLRLKGLGLRRGRDWLMRGFDLTVDPGTFVGIVGPSGVGKSSLLHCLAGELEAQEGSVRYLYSEGVERTSRQMRGRIGFIFQGLNLTHNATVLENVLCGRLYRHSFARTLWGFPRASRQEAFAYLNSMEIAEYVHTSVGEISGGERQRAAIARTLFQEPALVLADEPVSQLDSERKESILRILKDETIECGKTLLCVLHDRELAERFAHLIVDWDGARPTRWRVSEVNR